ncbi:hypothetical protein BRADI_4g09811v3 [Brachypodium distachyon]|uniref:Knottin scorpion toxin-like domain-containing protein n=1 Tax=Brachypodium distachyon TaxID=15368 RepID=A0A2K2CLN5_BRADI|nr:hypothetical protein BRADI_4g09811v3 [Brachypodium distachyon]
MSALCLAALMLMATFTTVLSSAAEQTDLIPGCMPVHGDICNRESCSRMCSPNGMRGHCMIDGPDGPSCCCTVGTT